MAKRTKKIKERRIQRREERKARKKQWKLVKKMGTSYNANIFLQNSLTIKEIESYFTQFWPFLKEVLVFLKMIKITGKKADQTLQKVIDLGDTTMENGGKMEFLRVFVKSFKKLWPQITVGVGIITSFTGPKLDKVFDQILHVGDWISLIEAE